MSSKNKSWCRKVLGILSYILTCFIKWVVSIVAYIIFDSFPDKSFKRTANTLFFPRGKRTHEIVQKQDGDVKKKMKGGRRDGQCDVGILETCVKFTPQCGSGNVLRIVKGARKHPPTPPQSESADAKHNPLSLTSETSGIKIRQNRAERARKLSLIYERAEESFRQEPTCFRSFLAC